MRKLCSLLGEQLISRGFKLISGYGLNIGTSVVEGALLKLYDNGEPALEKHLLLRPFPRNLPAGMNEEGFSQRYREDMISKCEFAVFIAGTSRTHPESEGVLKEFEIALRLKKIPIPIGATGFAARRIWVIVGPKIKTIYDGKISSSIFSRLNDTRLSNEQLLDNVFLIIDKLSASSA